MGRTRRHSAAAMLVRRSSLSPSAAAAGETGLLGHETSALARRYSLSGPPDGHERLCSARESNYVNQTVPDWIFSRQLVGKRRDRGAWQSAGGRGQAVGGVPEGSAGIGRVV